MAKLEFPPVVVPVQVDSGIKARNMIERIYQHPDFRRESDFVEVRADAIKNLSTDLIDKVLKTWEQAKIFTLRHADEGGETNWGALGDEVARANFYMHAAQHPRAYFVDVEYAFVQNDVWQPLVDLIADPETPSASLLLSRHYFNGTPAIDSLSAELDSMCAFLERHEIDGVVKFATMITNENDKHTLAELARRAERKDFYATVVGMAKTRATTPFAAATRKEFPFEFDMCWTYACLDQPNAPGQISLAQVRDYQRERLGV